MPDLGGDSGNMTLNLSVKVVELLAKLLKYITESVRDRSKKHLETEKVKEVRTKLHQRDALRKMNGIYGLVDYKKMQKTGKNIDTLGITMTREEINKFSEHAKREGLVFSIIEDIRKGEEEQFFILNIFKEDIEKARGVVERVAQDKKIAAIDEAINSIKEKGDLTEQDIFDLKELEKIKEEIRTSISEEYNKDQNKAVFEEAMAGREEKVGKKCGFHESVNHFINGAVDNEKERFICERTNPLSYMECHSSNYMFHDKPKIKTDYIVYQEGQEVLRKNDKFFDGRPANYWTDVRNEIKKAGNFSDDLLMFSTKQDFEKYINYFNQQQKELEGLEPVKDRDYSAITDKLVRQFADNDALINEKGEVVDINTNLPLEFKDLNPEKAASIAESTIINNQINNYNSLAKIETDIEMLSMELKTKSDDKIKTEIDTKKQEYKELLEKEQKLKLMRSEVNGAQAQQEVVAQRISEQKEKNGRVYEKELYGSPETMRVWKKSIEDKKLKQGAEGNTGKEKNRQETRIPEKGRTALLDK